jgi:hypothetical protein
MKIQKLYFYILAGLLCGCLPVMSLHPLYTEKDLVFEEKLLGQWVSEANDSPTQWDFSHTDEMKNGYKLIFTDEKGRKGLFAAHLVKLENKLFLDVFPGEMPWEPADPNKVEWVYNDLLLIPAHTFVKVDAIEPQLKLSLTMESKLKELLKEDPNAVKLMSIDDKPILISTTPELQKFVLKYADGDKLFADKINLMRKGAPAQKPSKQ